MACDQLFHIAVLSSACNILDTLQPIATAKELVWPVFTGIGFTSAWILRRRYVRKLKNSARLNRLLEDRLAAETAALGQTLAEEKTRSNHLAQEGDRLAKQVTLLEARAPTAALANARELWKKGDDEAANRAICDWMEWESDAISEILIGRANWAAAAIGEYRSAGLAGVEAFAIAALAFDPTNKHALALLSDLSGIGGDDSRPSTAAALQLLASDDVRGGFDPYAARNALEAKAVAEKLYRQGYGHLAIPIARRAAAIFIELEGPYSDNSVACRRLTAELLFHLGRYGDALNIVEDIANWLSGNNPESTERIYLTFLQSKILRFMGRTEEALLLARSGLRASEQAFGSRHGETYSYNILVAQSLRDLGELKQAIEILKNTAKQMTEDSRFGAKDRNRLVCLQALADTLHRNGDDEEALAVLNGMIDDQTAAFGPNDPETLNCRENMSVVLEGLGRYEEARTTLEPVVAAMRASSVLGPSHRDTLIASAQLGRIYMDLNRLDEAVATLQAAVDLAFASTSLGPDNPDTFVLRSSLVLALKQRGDLDEALAIVSDMLTNRSPLLKENDNRVEIAKRIKDEILNRTSIKPPQEPTTKSIVPWNYAHTGAVQVSFALQTNPGSSAGDVTNSAS